MNKIQNDIAKVGTFLIFSLLIFSSLNFVDLYKPKNVIYADISAYYTYLPAVFLYQDLELEFIDDLPNDWHDKIWRYQTEIGKPGLKMTSGLSFLYLPFFLLAHILALIFGYVPNGYSIPYAVMLLVASAFYTSIAFFYTCKVLIRFFRFKVAILTSILLIFATNLFIYSTSFGAYSHSFNFFLFTFFIWKTITYYDNPKFKDAILIGLSFGLITLIRPTNGLIALFFILFDVNNVKSFLPRCRFFFEKRIHIIIIAGFAALIWAPQLLYWKFISGEFFHYSYGDEGFFFDNPRIIEGLFGFRKGWLIYTPVMGLALIGLIFMAFSKESRKNFFLPSIIFIPINIYIILSWWCWWYGGSFGQRSFIESYAVLSIPLAFIIDKGISFNKKMKYIVVPICIFFVYLNLFQSWQYSNGILHFSDMTKSAYLRIWGKISKPSDLECLLKTPDYDIAKFEGKDQSYYRGCPTQVSLTPEQAMDSLREHTQILENHFLSIKFDEKVFAERLSVTLDENDIYELCFFNKRKLLAKELLYVKQDKSGLYLYEHEFQSKVKRRGFDEIKIFPSGGDKLYFFGSLTVE